jgi:predicted AlkP superfamily pyrophosphatase or phosphodiesterase
MSKFLVQLDELNYPNKIARKLPAGEDASDWLELTMSTQLDSDFALHFDKYPVNPDTKTFTPRVGAPTGVTNDQLLEQYNAAIAEIRKLKDDNTTKDTTIDQLKTDLATANSNIDLTNQALMEFATATMPTTDTNTSESQSESTSESTTESASGSATEPTSTTLSESASESESTKGSDK